MNIKTAVLILIGTISFTFCNNLFAAPQQLTKNVVDVLHSDQWTVTYKLTTITDDMTEDTKRAVLKANLIYTYAKKGNSILFKQGTTHMLFKDDELYTYTKNGNNITSFNAKKNTITRMEGEEKERLKAVKDPFYMRYYLLPYVDSDNWAYDINGEKIYNVNHCNVFVKMGEENIHNEKLQYEEWTTPEHEELKQICRYYFKNGKLIKIIQINKPAFIEDADWGAMDVPGSYTIMDILEITSTFDTSILEFPADVKFDTRGTNGGMTSGGLVLQSSAIGGAVAYK